MKHSITQKLLKDIAKKHGLPKKEVEEIIRSEFDFLAYQISSGDRDSMDFNNTRLIHIGSFVVTDGKREFFKKRNKQKKEQ